MIKSNQKKTENSKRCKWQKKSKIGKLHKDASGKNLKIRKCENVQVAEEFEYRTIPKNARYKKNREF